MLAIAAALGILVGAVFATLLGRLCWSCGQPRRQARLCDKCNLLGKI
jgi:hypothetical protein